MVIHRQSTGASLIWNQLFITAKCNNIKYKSWIHRPFEISWATRKTDMMWSSLTLPRKLMAVNPQGSSMQKRPRTHVSLLQSAGPFVRKQLFFVFIAYGSEKWQNNVIRGHIHTCDRHEGGHSRFHIYLPQLLVSWVPKEACATSLTFTLQFYWAGQGEPQ